MRRGEVRRDSAGVRVEGRLEVMLRQGGRAGTVCSNSGVTTPLCSHISTGETADTAEDTVNHHHRQVGQFYLLLFILTILSVLQHPKIISQHVTVTTVGPTC